MTGSDQEKTSGERWNGAMVDVFAGRVSFQTNPKAIQLAAPAYMVESPQESNLQVKPSASTSSTSTLILKSAFPATSNMFNATRTVGGLSNFPAGNLTLALFRDLGSLQDLTSAVPKLPEATFFLLRGNAIQHMAAPCSEVSPQLSMCATNDVLVTFVACALMRQLRFEPDAMSRRLSQHMTCGVEVKALANVMRFEVFRCLEGEDDEDDEDEEELVPFCTDGAVEPAVNDSLDSSSDQTSRVSNCPKWQSLALDLCSIHCAEAAYKIPSPHVSNVSLKAAGVRCDPTRLARIADGSCDRSRSLNPAATLGALS